MKRIITVLAALLLAGCAADPIVAHYPQYDKESLVKEASAIVAVKVVSVRDSMLEPDYSDPTLDPRDNPDDPKASGVPVHVFTVEVIKPFKWDRKTVAEGGKSPSPGDRTEVREEGQHTLQVGQSYVLFLETYPDSPASILGGNQGIFIRTDDGKIKSATSDESYTEEELSK